MSLTTQGSRGRRIVVLVLVLVVGATAWTFAARDRESASAPERPAVSLDELSRKPPIYDLLYTRTASKERIAVAKQQLITRCMADLGFTYRPAPVAKADDADVSRPTPFGLESLDPLGADTEDTLPPEEPKGEAFTRALFGDPDKQISVKGKLVQVSQPATGCQAEAEKRLLGDGQTRWLELRIRLGEGEDESRKRLERDPAFRAANARWQQCIRQAGIDAKDPVQLLKALPADTDIGTHPATRADVRCKDETDYLTTAYTRLAALQHEWLDENPDVLADRESLLLRQDTVARDVLKEGS